MKKSTVRKNVILSEAKNLSRDSSQPLESPFAARRMTGVSERPSWDEYFSRITSEVATRSTCLRRHVGAILVLDKRILATGYNGAPRGVRHCHEIGCMRAEHNVPSGTRHELCRGLHAEMNVLIQAANHGIRVQDATLYSTIFPCSLCAKMLINGGIRRIVAQGDYADPLAKELLSEAGVKVDFFDPMHHKTRPFPMRASAVVGRRNGKGKSSAGKNIPQRGKTPQKH